MVSLIGIEVKNFSLFNKGQAAGIKRLREIVCYNQGKLAEYTFMGGEKHKIIKDEMRSEKPDLKALAGYIKDLEGYLNVELDNAAKNNFRFLLQFLNGRGGI
jgi:hypothetical protein